MISSPPSSDIVFFGITISFYGIAISLGLIAAYSVCLKIARRTNTVKPHYIDGVLLWMLIPAIVCARLLFVLYHLDYFSIYPAEIPAVWHGGWVWHGGLAGGLIGLWLYCKRTAVSFLSLLDVLAPGVALGQAIGRWGNYFNQEAYGLPTNLPWAITIDPARRLFGYETFATFHPTFLYESVFDIFLFLFLGWIFFRRQDPDLRQNFCGAYREGMIFFLYLLLYSLGRFGIEFLRIDDVPLILGLRVPQWISLVLGAVGTVGLVWVLRKQKKVV